MSVTRPLVLLEESAKKWRIRATSMGYYLNLVDYIKAIYSLEDGNKVETIDDKIMKPVNDRLKRVVDELKENISKACWSSMNATEIFQEIKVIYVKFVCGVCMSACMYVCVWRCVCVCE